MFSKSLEVEYTQLNDSMKVLVLLVQYNIGAQNLFLWKDSTVVYRSLC